MATKVRVIQQGLKYRLFNKRLKKMLPVLPEIGDIISIPDEVVDKEINTGNVRKLNPDEKKALKAKAEANKRKRDKKKAK